MFPNLIPPFLQFWPTNSYLSSEIGYYWIHLTYIGFSVQYHFDRQSQSWSSSKTRSLFTITVRSIIYKVLIAISVPGDSNSPSILGVSSASRKCKQE